MGASSAGGCRQRRGQGTGETQAPTVEPVVGPENPNETAFTLCPWSCAIWSVFEVSTCEGTPSKRPTGGSRDKNKCVAGGTLYERPAYWGSELMAETALREEFEYYLEHQAELAAKHQGRYIVIKGRRVLGDYETADQAVRATASSHEPGTFLVQRCDADPESTKVTFRSRVRFA